MKNSDPEVQTARAGRETGKWRRRRFLVNRRYQLKIALLAVTLVLALVVLVNFNLIHSTMKETEATLSIAPEFEEYLKAQDREQFLLILLASLIFLIGVFLVSILESHKTAGAVLNIRNRLDEIRSGNLQARVRLRKDDNLMELEQAINRMTETLEERNSREIEILDRLGAKMDREVGRQTHDEIASEIRNLAATKRPVVD